MPDADPFKMRISVKFINYIVLLSHTTNMLKMHHQV
jgi:hypothetical protein